MALDSEFFRLNRALQNVWNDENVISPEQKRLIEACIGRSGSPEGEDELDEVQIALTSCNSLNRIAEEDSHWLSLDGQKFPSEVEKYIYNVATSFHETIQALPNQFVEPLVDFIKDTYCNIATLNYDRLLYEKFIEYDILLRTYQDTYLVDGMLRSGFKLDNFERKMGNEFGYYLHLHGSPLFYDDETSGTLRKFDRCVFELNQRRSDNQIVGRHIVLTHVKHKPSIIAASPVLSVYWNLLQECLSDGGRVTLFGYSGDDIHLNQLLKRRNHDHRLRIVEWDDGGDYYRRRLNWSRRVSGVFDLVRMQNILEFTDWE